jgi:hypothetical protein
MLTTPCIYDFDGLGTKQKLGILFLGKKAE